MEIKSFTLSHDGIPEISPAGALSLVGKVKIIDVRRPDEFDGELGHISGAQLITLESELQQAFSTLPKDQCYIFVCRSGARSGRATAVARQLGFNQSFNMSGGMIQWNSEKLPLHAKK